MYFFNKIENYKGSIEYCVDILEREVKEDNKLLLHILFVMLSAYSNDPRNLAINAPSGEGKSYNLTKVGDMFPKGDILFISHMSEKALFHRKGTLVIKNEQGEYISIEDKIKEFDEQIENKEFELSQTNNKDLRQSIKSFIKSLEEEKKDLQKNALKLIDLQHKILVFLDTPKSELLNAIMTLLSHDRYEVEYEFVDNFNGIKTKNNVLRGWPVVIFAQAVDYSHHPRWPEIQRRFIITNPKMSKEKYEKAINLIGDRNGLPDFAYKQKIVSEETKENVREIIRYIKDNMLDISDRLSSSKNPVIIPFRNTITESLPKEKASDMTFAERILGLVKLLSLIKNEKRPYLQIRRKGDTKIQKYPFALFEDLSESLFLMEYSDGVRPYVLDWYYDVFLELYNSKNEPDIKINSKGEKLTEGRIAVTTEELVKKTLEINGKTYTKKQILDTYINPLANSGYLDKTESKLDQRQNIYYPLISTEKNKKLFEIGESNNFVQIRKLIVKNITYFPVKEYIISEIRSILKYSESIDGFVKIFDHEGNELTKAEELAEKYYDNGEYYFSKLQNVDESSDDCPVNVGKKSEISKLESVNYSKAAVVEGEEKQINSQIGKGNCSKSDQVSEYSGNGQILDKLYKNNNENINISNNLLITSKQLFEQSESNNFLFSDNSAFKCYYCNSEFSTEEEHLKHSVNSHPRRIAQPDKKMIDFLKSTGDNIEPKGNPWE